MLLKVVHKGSAGKSEWKTFKNISLVSQEAVIIPKSIHLFRISSVNFNDIFINNFDTGFIEELKKN